jgi:hypothetical protein
MVRPTVRPQRMSITQLAFPRAPPFPLLRVRIAEPISPSHSPRKIIRVQQPTQYCVTSCPCPRIKSAELSHAAKPCRLSAVPELGTEHTKNSGYLALAGPSVAMQYIASNGQPRIAVTSRSTSGAPLPAPISFAFIRRAWSFRHELPPERQPLRLL